MSEVAPVIDVAMYPKMIETIKIAVERNERIKSTTIISLILVSGETVSGNLLVLYRDGFCFNDGGSLVRFIHFAGVISVAVDCQGPPPIAVMS